MSKLYVAQVMVLNPNNFKLNQAISIESEQILVQRVPFGFQEVFTNHFFTKKKVLESNLEWNSNDYPYKVCDLTTIKNLNDQKMQFVLDKNKSFPLREAEESDARDYIIRFPKSELNKYYKEEERKRNEEKQERRRIKATKQKAKELVKKHRRKINN